ncbi:aspartate/glutamate racemase family protein [Candidatus Woesearchaeota archaeon]|nr:aspartate/glutamate racemase family protein [Candidatus Woesearchaeota archaeon]
MISGGNSTLRIGVLGGIGPESTAVFYSKLIEKLQATGLIKSNTDFPQIIINSVPAPELISNNHRAIKHYERGLKELDSFGVDFIVMVCNTVHLFLPRLQRGVKTRILDLREAVYNELKKRKVSRIAVLATENTITQRLYEFNDLMTIRLETADIKALNNAIINFNIGNEKSKQRLTCERLAERCYDEGAQLIVLGCTELAVMLEKCRLPSLNTIDVLVHAIIIEYRNRMNHCMNPQYLNSNRTEARV